MRSFSGGNVFNVIYDAFELIDWLSFVRDFSNAGDWRRLWGDLRLVSNLWQCMVLSESEDVELRRLHCFELLVFIFSIVLSWDVLEVFTANSFCWVFGISLGFGRICLVECVGTSVSKGWTQGLYFDALVDLIHWDLVSHMWRRLQLNA